MAEYYLAPSLVSLRNEINEAHPNRDHTSDGWIGDASHQARVSDHNPDYTADGVVRAIDVDKDGIDTDALLRAAFADSRTEYVIFNGLIYERANGFRPRKYTGANQHTGHVHISLRHIKSAEKSGKWGYAPGNSPAPSTPTPSFEQVVAGVIAGQYGNGDERARRVAAAGQNYEAVRAEVNRRLGGSAPAAPARKSDDQIASEVIGGHWGNGPERSRRLQAAGYNPTAIQNLVNSRLGTTKPVSVRLSVGQLADQVIRGQWGSNPERRRRLIAAGYDANAVQAEVNRRL